MTIDEAIKKYETLEHENMAAAAEWHQKYINYQDHDYKNFADKCEKTALEQPNSSKQQRVFKKLVKDKKDYYSIIWEEDGEEYEGYSSFSLDVISDFLKEYFMSEQNSSSQMPGTSDAVNRILAIETAIDAADEWDGGYDITREQIIRDALEKLPSAQPLVIHCTDCEGWLKRQSVLGFAVSELPSAEPEQQWIPCSERLPEDWVPVLVTLKKPERLPAWIKAKPENYFHIVDTDVCENGEWWVNKKNVTAWMPLPKPYGGDTND